MLGDADWQQTDSRAKPGPISRLAPVLTASQNRNDAGGALRGAGKVQPIIEIAHTGVQREYVESENQKREIDGGAWGAARRMMGRPVSTQQPI